MMFILRKSIEELSMSSKYVSLQPRKPSKAFTKVFQANAFNDNLRPENHQNKGKSWGHFQKEIFK
tara:strand:- start:818 stop:1012 length:195 start_codon:yes stop_codon:yes gene_type:complete